MDELLHHILSSFSELEQEHDSVTKHIAHIYASLQEYNNQQHILGSGNAVVLRQDSVNGDTYDEYIPDTKKRGMQEVQPLGANERRGKRTRKPTRVDSDEEVTPTIEPSTLDWTDYRAQPQSLQIGDDIDSRASKLVDQVMLGNKLLSPTNNCDARS